MNAKKRNPIVIFDYIYFRIAYFYEHRFFYGQVKEFGGIMILSLVQQCNILILLKLLNLKSMLTGSKMLIVYLSLYIMFFIFNLIRYGKIIEYNTLETRWNEENRKVRHFKSILIILYFFFTFFFLG